MLRPRCLSSSQAAKQPVRSEKTSIYSLLQRPRARSRKISNGDPADRLRQFTGLEEVNCQVPLAAGGRILEAEQNPVAIFWDMDNIAARDVGKGMLMSLRLRAAVEEVAGPVTTFHAYGNQNSFRFRRSHLGKALALLGIKSYSVTIRKNAADFAIKSAVYAFAAQRQHAGHACVAIVSSDNGYANAAKHCRSLGIQVISIGSHAVRDPMRPLLWTKNLLPQSSDIALRWRARHLVAASPGEVEQLQALKRSASVHTAYVNGVIRQALVAEAGSMGEIWINPELARCDSVASRFSGVGVGKAMLASLSDAA